MKTVFYGLGLYATSNKEYIISLINKYNPSFWCDADASKYGSYFGIPVISFEEAETLCSGCSIFITVDPLNTQYKIQKFLLEEMKVNKLRILNYLEYTEGKFCNRLLSSMVFGIHSGVEYCCMDYGSNTSPLVKHNGDCAETAQRFMDLRETILIKLSRNEDNPCMGCNYIETGIFPENPKILLVNFTAGDGYDVCNLKCQYCELARRAKDKGLVAYDNCVGISFEDRLKICDYFQQKGLLDEKAEILLSCGEPAIHPKLSVLIEHFRDYKMRFYSNATVYESQIAKKIGDGKSDITISVGAGTAMTYKNMKGVDAFDKVVSNAIKYAEKGNVVLQYLFASENINSNLDDSNGFINICKRVKPRRVTLIDDAYNYQNPLTDETKEQCKYICEELSRLSIPFYIKESLYR